MDIAIRQWNEIILLELTQICKACMTSVCGSASNRHS